MKIRLPASLLLALAISSGPLAAAPDSSIEEAFDRQKGKIYAAYRKALREQPGLEGRVDVEFSVAKDGKASGCRVVLSELGSSQLDGRLCEIVETMNFGARKAPSTVVKRIDFVPLTKLPN